MTLLTPISQVYYRDQNGLVIGLHQVVLLTTSDTLTVARLANATSPQSCAGLSDGVDLIPTVTNSDVFTVAIVGTVGRTVLIVTRHGPGSDNSADEL